MPKVPLTNPSSQNGHLLVAWNNSTDFVMCQRGKGLYATIETILEDFDHQNDVEPRECWLQVASEDGNEARISHSVFRSLPKTPLPHVRLIREFFLT
jgi:hypothetical protein